MQLQCYAFERCETSCTKKLPSVEAPLVWLLVLAWHGILKLHLLVSVLILLKGFASVKKEDSSQTTAVDKTRVQAQMCAALNACVELHQRGELDTNLEPVDRCSTFEFVGQDNSGECEVADGGLGWDGSLKRRRAYKRKVGVVFTVSRIFGKYTNSG